MRKKIIKADRESEKRNSSDREVSKGSLSLTEISPHSDSTRPPTICSPNWKCIS